MKKRTNSLANAARAHEFRLRMVDQQLVTRGVREPRVLDAFRRVPRHLFCAPNTSLGTAHGDYPLSIGHGQTISQPLMVAEMTQALDLCCTDKVLEIGTGSGYQAAILAMLAGEVHTVERIVPLANQARERFGDLEIDNVHVHIGDGTAGWPDEAPYDAIIVTAAAPRIPEPLKEQLRDGGRLAIPVGPRHIQDFVLCRRAGVEYEQRPLGGCRFVPLIGEHGWPD